MTLTVILGPDYDQHLRATVIEVMGQLGASIESWNWCVAGSQEVETVQAQLAGNVITIDAETYIGLSIAGEENMINEPQRQFSRPSTYLNQTPSGILGATTY